MTDDEPLYPHTPGPGCLHCEILGIDFGENDAVSDPGDSHPPPAGATITPGDLSDLNPWASRPAPHGEG
jgi:hypothetical protein